MEEDRYKLVPIVVTGLYIRKNDTNDLVVTAYVYEWKEGLDRNDVNFYAKTRQGHMDLSAIQIRDMLSLYDIFEGKNYAHEKNVVWSD